MMSEEQSHDKLDQLLDLTKENNRILRSMHRRMLWSQFFSYVYWLVILGSIGWTYYYLQPYISQYVNTYQTIMTSLNSMEAQSKSFPTNLQGILEKVR
jgi:membrane protein required for beta-lactamase induction